MIRTAPVGAGTKFRFILASIFFLSQVGVQIALANDESNGAAVVCFKPDSKIPQILREKDSQTHQPIHPDLKDEYFDEIVSVQAFDLALALSIRDFDNPVPGQVVPIGDHEKSSEFVERIAKRFDFTIPIIAKKIRAAQAALPEKGAVLQNFRLAPIHDEAYLQQIDSTHCIVASISRIVQVGDQSHLEYDGKLLSKAQELDPAQARLSRAVLMLSDLVQYGALADGLTKRDQIRPWVAEIISVQSGLTVGKVFRDFRAFGFSGDPGFPKDDLRNAFVWNLVGQVFDALWNSSQSIYKVYESSVVQDIVSQLPRLQGCLFFERKPIGNAYPIFDCGYLMSSGLWFPPIPPGMKMSADDQSKANALLSKYKDFSLKMIAFLQGSYQRDWQDKILSVPYIDPEKMKAVDTRILATIRDGILTAQYAGPKDKPDQPIPYQQYGIDLEYAFPDQW